MATKKLGSTQKRVLELLNSLKDHSGTSSDLYRTGFIAAELGISTGAAQKACRGLLDSGHLMVNRDETEHRWRLTPANAFDPPSVPNMPHTNGEIPTA